MQIANREVKFNFLDEIALEAYMGKGTESIEAWVERVSKNCDLYQNNNGLDEQGRPLPIVFQNDFETLWENKKARRKKALIRDVLGIKEYDSAQEDQLIQDCKEHPKYEKQSDRYDRMLAEEQAKQEQLEAEMKEKISLLLKQGMKKEAIAIVLPGSERFLPQTEATPKRAKVGKV